MLADLTARAALGELSRDDVTLAMTALLDLSVTNETKAGFLRTWARRSETAAELAACAEELLPRAVVPPVQGLWNGKPLLDCCGTGGGGLNLVNISTGIVFILAAMGVPVVKHGNRGLTKKSGSADVLEALGIRIDLPPEKMEACLEEVGAAFLFAPAYHTSFSAIAPVRRQLGAEGQRTVFNLLGPLLNPARPDARLVGVFKETDVSLYQEALNFIGCRQVTVACGAYGDPEVKLGEASPGVTFSGSTVSELNGRQDFSAHFTSKTASIEPLYVADAAQSAARLQSVLSGDETGLLADILVLNAAIASQTVGGLGNLSEHIQAAREAVTSKRALGKLDSWRRFSAKS